MEAQGQVGVPEVLGRPGRGWAWGGDLGRMEEAGCLVVGKWGHAVTGRVRDLVWKEGAWGLSRDGEGAAPACSAGRRAVIKVVAGWSVFRCDNGWLSALSQRPGLPPVTLSVSDGGRPSPAVCARRGPRSGAAMLSLNSVGSFSKWP